MNSLLTLAPEVRSALEAGQPVVALESTLIAHGMPYPQNLEMAGGSRRLSDRRRRFRRSLLSAAGGF